MMDVMFLLSIFLQRNTTPGSPWPRGAAGAGGGGGGGGGRGV